MTRVVTGGGCEAMGAPLRPLGRAMKTPEIVIIQTSMVPTGSSPLTSRDGYEPYSTVKGWIKRLSAQWSFLATATARSSVNRGGAIGGPSVTSDNGGPLFVISPRPVYLPLKTQPSSPSRGGWRSGSDPTR